MTFPAQPFPDALPDIRYFLRNHAYLASLTAGRVFFRVPPKPTKAPFMRIWRSGGGLQTQGESEAPVLDLRVNIDVWGLTMADYDKVRATQLALEAIAFNLQTGIIGPNNTRLINLAITNSNDSPDPDTGWPRLVTNSIWTVSF